MYIFRLEIEVKREFTKKESYELVASLLRRFIQQEGGVLAQNHYQSHFSYYTFGNLYEIDSIPIGRKPSEYKKGATYALELRTLHCEFLNLKGYKGLETERLKITSVSGGPLFYRGEGELASETPVFMKSRPIKTKADEEVLKEAIRENIVFRYLKSEYNSSDNIERVRHTTIREIDINKKAVGIPFAGKRLKNGSKLIYHCLHMRVIFEDDAIAREVQQVLYAGGLGKLTSNGFGFLADKRRN